MLRKGNVGLRSALRDQQQWESVKGLPRPQGPGKEGVLNLRNSRTWAAMEAAVP